MCGGGVDPWRLLTRGKLYHSPPDGRRNQKHETRTIKSAVAVRTMTGPEKGRKREEKGNARQRKEKARKSNEKQGKARKG